MYLNISLLIIYLLICFASSTSIDNLKPNCVGARNLFTNEGLYSNDKSKPDSGNLRICRKERSCCTRNVEFKLNIKSKSDFQSKFKQLINNSIEANLINWSEQFNKYFLNSIKLGHTQFDSMFKKLYGIKYEENLEIFNQLFYNIELYHDKGELDLELALNDFFEKLFIGLFKMLNPSFQFQPDYIKCISDNMNTIEPFGDITKKLLNNLKRQLGATRTFVQGLYAGAKIINQLNQIDIGNSCGIELMQINYCSLCSGHLNLKPCKPNCEWAYSKCIVNYQDFEIEWNKYLVTIIQFGRRLENTLNLENTLGSLNYKISDMIMHFQENKSLIIDKVFEKCNVNKIKNINKRSTSNIDDEDDDLLINKETNIKNEEINKIWKKLATDVKRKIKTLKSYWSKLPKAICKNSNQITAINKCWNGTNSIDLNKQIKPSFDIRIQKNSIIYQLINTQKTKLQMVNNKLISSYNGNGLEKFDFDSQASVNFVTATEPYEDDNEDDEEDPDYDDSKNNRELDQQQIPDDEPIEKNLESQDDNDGIESKNDNVKRNQNDLENNIYSDSVNLDKPKDASLTNNKSFIINISIYTFIISQFILILLHNRF